MRWMLDTNVCIAMIKLRPVRLLRRLQAKAVGQVGISSVALAELSFGAARSTHREANRAAIEDFLLSLEIAPFDAEAARCYGPLRATLAASGTPIGPLDNLIAAHAIALNAILVTHNVREFRRVEGLHVENWLAP